MEEKNMETELVTQKEFDDLLEYSTTYPTGTTIGKVWKRHNYIFKSKGQLYNAGQLPNDVELIEERWLHCEYVPSIKEGYIAVKLKILKIVGNLEIDKTIGKSMERRKK